MRVAVTDLVGRPGATRPLRTTVERDDIVDLGVADEALVGPIEVDAELDSVVEGILVRGRLAFGFVQPCARCLTDVRTDLGIEVAELFVDPARSDEEVEEGYELDADAIDIEALVRDTVVTAIPVRVLCREDCRGLCPVCGADRNEQDCGHEAEVIPDRRWSALGSVQLPPA